MEKKYLIGAAILGVAFIGGTWLFSDDSVTSKSNAPASSGGIVYDAPAQPKAPAGGDDAKF